MTAVSWAMAMASPTDFIQNDDATVKKWIKEIIETESLLKRMQNDLEVEQAKGKVVVSELEGEILKLEEFMNVSMSNENNRLKTLMVNQLVEVNKKEVLANIYLELHKQRETFTKELPASSSKSNIQPTDDEKNQETQLPKKEDRSKIEEDILRIEGDIAEAEKEQISRKQCLVQHQELLDEFKILSEFTNSNEPSLATEVPEINFPTSEVQSEKPRGHLSASSENYGSTTPSNSRSNPTSEVFTMDTMSSGHEITENIPQNNENKKETYYGPYNAVGKNSAFVLKTSKRMNRIGSSSDTNKRSKLDLYDLSGKASTDPIIDLKNDETSASMKRTTTAFKLKTPSRLQRTIN